MHEPSPTSARSSGGRPSRRRRPPAGARPPRVRGLRRAAGDGDPARVRSRSGRRCRPSATSPSGWGSPGRRCARRSRRCGRPGWCARRGAAAAGRWCRTARPPGDAAGRRASPNAGSELLDSLVFRRVVEPGACYVAASRTLTGLGADVLTTALAEVDQAEDAAAHRQADSRLHLAIAIGDRVADDDRGGHRGAGLPARHAPGDPGARGQHRPLQPPAPRDRQGRSSTGEPTKARRAMEQHCDDTAALLRGLLG